MGGGGRGGGTRHGIGYRRRSDPWGAATVTGRNVWKKDTEKKRLSSH